MKLVYPNGATPLDPDELKDLIPSDIATQEQLNFSEQSNIIEARHWALSRKNNKVLSEEFLRKLHHRMFCLVWRWAGNYRKTEKNLGVSWSLILEEIGKLFLDTSYWIDHQVYSWEELGARFHHRLVSIHPFPNGNGRHARLMTDVLFFNYEQKPFTWGQKERDENFKSGTEIRKSYIQSLRNADQNFYEDLIKFVRS